MDTFALILADGLGTKVNEEGIAFYNNVIDALLEKGMMLFVLHFFLNAIDDIHFKEHWLYTYRYRALCDFASLGSSIASS